MTDRDNQTTVHVPVLLEETLQALSPKKGDVLVDATLGGGGHTEALLQAADVRVIALDADPEALGRASERLVQFGDRVTYLHSNFRHLKRALAEIGVEKVQGVLMDLGLSSDELEQSGRGFSFQRDEPLHMGFDPEQSLIASDLLAHLNEDALATILVTYGQERFAKRIAHAVIKARELQPITTTTQLITIIEDVVPHFYKAGRTHPATKTFQALRIAVNDEFDSLREGLTGAWEVLEKDGRLAVISFHSSEDRIVKFFMKEKVIAEEANLFTKKPITPSQEELTRNPRSRSSKLRALTKLI